MVEKANLTLTGSGGAIVGRGERVELTYQRSNPVNNENSFSQALVPPGSTATSLPGAQRPLPVNEVNTSWEQRDLPP